MGLARLMGMLFFFVIGFGLFNYLNNKYGLNLQTFGDIQNLGLNGYIAVAVSTIAGLVGFFIGIIVGSSIEIKNDDLSDRITIGWHYLANANMIWLPISTIGVYLSMGNMAKIFFEAAGKDYLYVAAIMATIGSQLIAISINLSGGMIRRGNVKMGRRLARALPLTITVLMGAIQFYLFNLNFLVGIVSGYIFPFILIAAASQSWRPEARVRDDFIRF